MSFFIFENEISPKLTSVSLLVDHVLDLALVGGGHGLLGDGSAAIVEALGLVHGALEGISLPAEHVVSVGAVALALEAPHERVGGARRPHAVERGGVPHGLEGHLRRPDGVGGRARSSVGEAVRVDGVVHVRLVVGAVKVLAIPASNNFLGLVNQLLFFPPLSSPL